MMNVGTRTQPSKDDSIIPYAGLRARLVAVDGMGELMRAKIKTKFADIMSPSW